ncbi:hypothetical protein ADICYQ_3629 [Cyclobacterium qasimii M12-11B]|uniref:Uncharacterized protein n=1 Tax=Cyclobacterium qasimii M12-11B TaxID=641524 RepID=S7VBK3_9BACT|nr:hypothetical protein ADICYQ_3629 [Cyclobacterium qasimii M12-11B]
MIDSRKNGKEWTLPDIPLGGNSQRLLASSFQQNEYHSYSNWIHLIYY